MKCTFLPLFVNITIISLLSACGGGPSTSTPPEQVVPITLSEIEEYFDSYPCGVDFNASFGVGDSSLGCYRTPGGGAECIQHTGNNTFSVVPVVWLDSQIPVTDVLHASAGGTRGTGVTIVTTDGQVFHGGFQGLSAKPLVDSGAISVSGGFFDFCAIVNSNNKNDVLCSDGSHGDYTLERPKGLPEGFEVMQIVVSWDEACALNSKGEQWCWYVPDGNPAPIHYSSPVKFISIDNSFNGGSCAIKFDGGVECTGLNILQAKNLGAHSIGLSGRYVVSVDSSGSAVLHDNETNKSLGVKDVSVIGGRSVGGSTTMMMLINKEGEVYRIDYDGVTHKIEGAKSQAAACPLD